MGDQASTAAGFLAGGGAMGERLRTHDWAATPLGPLEAWPVPVRTLVSVMLSAGQPMWLGWGPELIMLYNDGYAEMLGGKHPRALGRPLFEVWGEIRADIEPLIEQVLAGEGVNVSDLRLDVERGRGLEEAHFDFSYTPMRDQTGAVAGLFCAVNEITGQIMAERERAAAVERSRAILDSIAEGFILLAPDFTIQQINAEGLRIAGRPAAAVVGRLLLEVWPEAEALPPWAAYRQAMADRRPFELIYRHLSDTDDVWLEVRGSPSGDGLAVLFRDVTERKRAEAALEATRAAAAKAAAETSAILGQLAEGVIVTDAAGRITFVNPAAVEMHGVAELDVEPDAYSETYHLFTEDGRPHPPRELPLARAVAGEVVEGARWRIRRPDGTEVLADGGARPLRGVNGEQIGAVLTLRDVTEREQAEAALRESEARLRALTDNLPSGMVYQIATGPDGTERRFLFVSQSHERLTGVPADAVLADPTIPYTLILPEHRERLVAAEAEAIRDLAPFDVEAPLRRADTGEVRWTRIISAPRRTADGGLIWDGIQIDITDRKLAENELRQNAERLRLIVEGASDHAISTLDAAGRITSWSGGAERIFGWSAAEAIGQHASLIFTPEDVAAGAPEQEMETARLTGCANDERWHICKDGGRVFMNGSAHPLHDATGATVGYMKIARDETARRAQDEQLRASEARLNSVLESVSDGFYALDAEWRLTLFNAAAEAYFEVRREDVLGRALWDLFPEGLGTPYETQMRALMEGGPAFRFEAQSLIRPGRYMELRASAKAGGGIAVSVSDITERVLAEAKRQESEAVLRAFFNTSGLYASVLELEGESIRYVMANENITGVFRLDEVAGRTSEDLLGRSPPPEVLRLLRRVEERGRPVSFEHPVQTPDGERWFSATVSPIPDARGRRLFAAASVDISQRRNAELALRDSEARFRAITETLPQIVWSTQPDGHHDYYNARWYEFTGVPQGSTDGEAWNDVFHPDDQSRAWESWRRSLETGEDYSIEYRLRRHDGVYRWVLGRARAVRDPTTREIVRWMGTCTEIQDIVEAREVLSRSREELERLVAERTADRDRAWRLSQDLLVVAEPSGVITAVNAAWTKLLGWTEDEMLGVSFVEFTHPDDLTATLAVFGSILERPLVTPYEYRFRAKDDSYRWFAWTAAFENGAIYASGRDTTDQRARAEELEKTQEQLRQSQKMEAVGQLTGGIAHDFNNLLQGITGSLDLVQKRVAQGRTGELDRFISGAMTSANRAAALTHRLLAFSRRQPLDPKPVRANPLLASMEDLLRRTIGENIELELVLAGGLWPTLCDPNQLESAILNLVINARDAMPDGGKLTVETCNAHLDSAYVAATREVAPGQYVCICVTDTGSGMSKEVIERAFDPFFTTKPIGQGTGLGLSMIYGFARQSEGYCKIYSEEGEGTTIKLYLPRFRGEALDDDGPVEAESPRAAEDGEVVVVIEDEPVVRGLIVEVLGELGYGALEASDGLSGLELLRTAPRVDLVVTDIGLPGLNGRQLVDLARERRPGLKVLFMTGYAENAAIANGFLEPGMSMITKPFAMETLATRIRDIIEGR